MGSVLFRVTDLSQYQGLIISNDDTTKLIVIFSLKVNLNSLRRFSVQRYVEYILIFSKMISARESSPISQGNTFACFVSLSPKLLCYFGDMFSKFQGHLQALGDGTMRSVVRYIVNIFNIKPLFDTENVLPPSDATTIYRQVSNIRRTLVGNKIVDHSDVVGATSVGAAPTTSSFST